jgi:hypothetical protein
MPWSKIEKNSIFDRGIEEGTGEGKYKKKLQI